MDDHTDENRILGPAMIPDKKIYRNPNSAKNEPHYVFFSAKTISKLRDKFHADNLENRVDINHDGIYVKGVIMTKSFLIDDINRNEILPEFKDLPNGTWMIEYKVEDEKIWKNIKQKKLKGFSVEGLFIYSDSTE